MNKVYSLLAAAFCLVAFSCAKQEIDNPASVGKTTRVKVKASIELPSGMTKSTISGSSFLWSVGDQIACYTTTGSFQNSDPLESEDITGANQSARFWFSLTGTNPYLKDVAVFPVFPDKKPTYDTSTETLTIKIPDTIAWVEEEVDNIEVAYFGGSSLTQNINLNFVNVAGVIKFTLNNLPVGANQVFFKTGKTITGDFVIENLSTKWSEYTSQQYDNLYISAGENSDTDGITFTFDEVNVAGTSKVFYVPVPTGTYSQIGFKVQNNNGQTVTNLWKKTATVSNTVGRGTMLVMPALTFASATGGGEGNPTNIITTLSGQTGAVALPSTTESVLVEMNTTAGALDLEYADGGEKPEKVYVKVLTDATVNTLNINLPNSTVYVNGLENSNVGTLSSVTAQSTLKVLASPLTIGKATINQGNVEIGGTVNSVVVAEGATSDGKSAGATNQVQIFVTKEAALQTITLNAKTDVVVEQPKDNIDAAATENKVYVIVNAVGSSATAQNGGDIYVTANANCTVTAGGGDSEPSANGSTATIDNTGSGTATQSEKSGGAIDTGELKKAQIGETKYATLAAAITAANANDEIVILVDQTVNQGYVINKNLTINLNGKTITANAASDNDSSHFTNNRLFHVEGSNIDFTINNGTIVLDEHIWGTVRFISQGGNLALTDVTTYNFREYGANIKLSYGHAAFNNVIMHSDKGGCVDIGDGAGKNAPSGATAEMTNCIFDQTNEGSIADDHISVSSAIITSYSGHVTLNSGTYSAYYALFPHSSGGTITVKDGCTITGRHNAVHTTTHGHTSTQEDHCIYIQGGTINGAFDVATDGHTTFSVTGGTFDHDPSAYVADGYVATQSGNVWTVAPISGVAAIGTQGYETLTAAFAAVNNNETITMLADVNLTDRIFVNAGATPTLDSGNRYATSTESKTITLDLNGHNITSTSNFAQAGGTFNITNTGTADDTHGVISTTTAGLAPVEVRGTGDLTAKRTLNVGAGVTLTGTTYGINVFGSNTADLNKIEVNVNGTVNGTIFVLGNLKNTANDISINVNGKVYVAAIDDDKRNVGVALNGYASVNVASTANVEGETGIEVRAGQLTVANGATITANASSFSYKANDSGSTTAGAAIAVVQHITGLPITATINGGTLTGVKKLYVKDEMGNYLDNVAVSAVEAIKNEAEIPAGFVWQANGNKFDLVRFFAAQIGETKYATLAEAIAAVPTDGTKTTIQMLADETMATGATLEVASTKNIVLDLNGKTVTGNGGVNGANFFFLTNRGVLEITDSSAGKNGKITGYWTNPNTGWGNQYNTIYNIDGKLTLSAGTVETTTGYLSYAINNSSNAWGVGDDKETVFTMTGGTVTAPSGDAAVRVYQNCGSNSNPYSHNTLNISGGLIKDSGIFVDTFIYKANPASSGDHINTTINISGGEIHGLIDLKMRHPYNTTVNVTGGSFRSSTLRVRKYVSEWGTGLAEPTEPVFNISNGDFQFSGSSSSDAFAVIKSSEPSNVWTSYANQYSITGGTFNVDPSDYVAAGYKATQTGNVWTVEENPYVAMIGSTGYESLAAAVAEAESGATIELVNDDNVSLTSGGEIVINKPLTITGAVDSYGVPKFTVYGQASVTGDYNDVFLTSASGTITISNIALSGFGNETAGSSNGRAPLFIGSSNNNAVIDNVYISEINTEAVHINGGTFSITNCAFDCYKESGFTRGIQVVNAASGSITNTAISNVVSSNNGAWTAPIELLGYGAITISDCELGADEEGYTMGIATGPSHPTQPASSQVSVANCSVSANKAIFGDGEYGALITIVSGEYEGLLVIGDAGQGISITGGTFDHDPSDYVAAGYGVTRSGDDYVVAAVTTTWDGSSKAALTDLGDDTYGIYSAAQLAQFAADVNGGNHYDGKTVKLWNSIDLNNNAWTPIGNVTSARSPIGNGFLGTFEGNNKTISKLSVTAHNGVYSYAGLFGSINPSGQTVTIQNLKIDNFAIDSYHFAGAILGETGHDSVTGKVAIKNCYVSNGNITTTPWNTGNGVYDDGNQAGGLVGSAYNYAYEITGNTVYKVNITGYRAIGGIAGFMTSATFTNNTVSSCNITQSNTNAYYGQYVWKLNTVEAFVGQRGSSETNYNNAWSYGTGNNDSDNTIVRLTSNE